MLSNSAQNNFQVNNQLPSGAWEFDFKLNKLLWSDDQFLIYGYNPGEFELNEEYFLTKTTHESDIVEITNIINNSLINEKGYSFKRRVIKKNGKLGFVETHAEILRSSDNVVNKIVGKTINIEGQKINGNYDNNDPMYFNQFYDNYKFSILRKVYTIVLNREISQDLCQEIFLKAWNKMSTYDPQKGEIYTWLLNIAINHCKDYLRSKYYKAGLKTTEIETTIKIGNEEVFDDGKLHVAELIRFLKPEHQEYINLLFLQGFSQSDVSKIKEIPLGTVKTKSRAAINCLRNILSDL